ncbi:MAG: DUF2007 domain-containing protein [Bacteroidales bacterium]|nr:DUF2007 domain-containing protein [Bacteroidales bacterium]MBN2818218.1 DUF2007 domain-containing protein [Bacteroidales bacterium]
MQENWIPVYEAVDEFRAELVKQVLHDNSIAAFILNQQDSSYHFGEVKVCVHQSDVIRAKHIISMHQL